MPKWLLDPMAKVEVEAPRPSYLQGSYAGHAKAENSRDSSDGKEIEDEVSRQEDSADDDEEEEEDEGTLPETEEERIAVAKIRSGFKIVEMTMRNGDTGKVVWSSKDLGASVLFDDDATKVTAEAHLPASMLSASSVTRSITFSSVQLMRHFFMTQRVYLHGQLLEKHAFDFGFVIPGSTNSWEQEIEAADDEVGTLDPALLSGNTTVVTRFYDKGLLLGGFTVRLFYDR